MGLVLPFQLFTTAGPTLSMAVRHFRTYSALVVLIHYNLAFVTVSLTLPEYLQPD
jgi:hypothetical protein